MKNIKRIALVLAVFISGLMIGCATTESEASDTSGFNMEYIESDLVNWVGDFYLYEDTETDVEYLVYNNNGNIAITPRYKADGSLYVNDK